MRDQAATGPAAWVLVVSGLAVLWGCAVAPVSPAPPHSLSGRLALQVYAAGSGSDMTQSVSAGFEWTGDALRGQLDLLSPLGSVLAQARWDEGGAWLRTSGGAPVWHASADDLAAHALGQRIPLAAVFDWLQARPWSQASYSTVNSMTFEQLGWRVDLTSHAKGRIVAQRLDPPLVTLRIQLDKSSSP